MPKTFLCQVVMTGAFLMGMSGVAGAATIFINNAGFETPVLASGTYQLGIPGWTTTGTAGVLNPVPTQMTATEGSQVGFSNGGSISQILSASLNSGVTYTLNVDFLARKDCCAAFGTQLQLMAGTAVLATFNGAALTTGQVRTDTLSFTTFNDPNLGQALGIVISTTGSGVQLAFDNVRLSTVVPEPATFGLCGGAFGLLLLAARYRKSSASQSA